MSIRWSTGRPGRKATAARQIRYFEEAAGELKSFAGYLPRSIPKELEHSVDLNLHSVWCPFSEQ